MVTTTIMGEQKVCSHRSQTAERGEWSRHTEEGRGACVCVCGVYMRSMKPDRCRERRTEGNRKTEKERRTNTTEKTAV